MDEQLLNYYQSELSYLRELGVEFAENFPKIAGRLKIEPNRIDDPHVDRLLEGVAFLTARIRKKLDDEFPEITEAFLNLLYPHYLRPLPSMAVVQLEPGPEPGKIIEGSTIPAGSTLQSAPVRGGSCPFRTVYPVTLWPLNLTEARLIPDRVVLPHKPAEAVALIQLTFKTVESLAVGQLAPSPLRLYINGAPPAVYALYELIFNHTCQVVIQGRRADGTTEAIPLPPGSIRPVGFGPEEGMVPYPARSFPGYRLIQEYFHFPEKFFFFDLTGLERLRGQPWGTTFEVQIFLDRSPRVGIEVDRGTFRLGCTPAVNLFRRVCDPIVLDRTQYEYRVVPDGQAQRSMEVYSIEEVTSAGSFLDAATRFEPLYTLRHVGGDSEASAYWYASRRMSLARADTGTEVFLSFVDPDFKPTRPSAEVLTVRALCTNRDIPSQLPFGEGGADFVLEAAGPVREVRCLCKPTPTLRPPAGRGLHGRLISHLALNHLSLVGGPEALESLREILRLYDWQDSPATRQQIQGLTALSSRRAVGRTGSRSGSAVCQGVEVTLEFDEANFVGSGFFLLASILERFLGSYVSINSFTQLVARTRQKEGILKRWPPRAGYRTLL